jgi:methyl-accepting chemotaxis protein
MTELTSILNNVANMEHARITTLGAVESISAVSEETTASSAMVSTNTEQQHKAVLKLDAETTKLLHRAKDLEDAINQFKIDD